LKIIKENLNILLAQTQAW